MSCRAAVVAAGLVTVALAACSAPPVPADLARAYERERAGDVDGALAALFAASKRFEVDYHVGFLPAEGLATVRIAVRPDSGRVVSLDFRMDAERYLDVQGEGEVLRDGERVQWTLPETGELSYRYRIDKRRRDGGFDARITADWTLVRADHLIPPLRARLTRDTDARARLFVDLPPGWSNVDTQYLRTRDGKAFVIVDPRQRFDRPTGWLIAGDVGTRREQIHGMEVSVGAPKGDPMRRNEYIAFINIVAPEMLAAFDALPNKMLIVGAGDPMWRGGLSGPRSLYLHSDRPILSENGTSTLIHELVHVVTRVRGESGDDWEAVAALGGLAHHAGVGVADVAVVTLLGAGEHEVVAALGVLAGGGAQLVVGVVVAVVALLAGLDEAVAALGVLADGGAAVVVVGVAVVALLAGALEGVAADVIGAVGLAGGVVGVLVAVVALLVVFPHEVVAALGVLAQGGAVAGVQVVGAEVALLVDAGLDEQVAAGREGALFGALVARAR